MNCSKCNKELKDGAKFCTGCGTKVESAPSNGCKSCGAPLKDGAKFCTSCGTKVEQSIVETSQRAVAAVSQPEEGLSKSVGGLNVISRKLIWNIQPGEIARVIDEVEFNNYKEIIGLIVNEGTKALIRLNGEVVAELSSGNYDFIDPKLLEAELKNQGGLGTLLKKGWNFIANILHLGKFDTDKKDISEIVKKMRDGAIFSVVLVLDIPIKLIYGAEQTSVDDYANYLPLRVQTQNLDVDLGLSALFCISNLREFTKRYLVAQKSISTTTLVAETSALIASGIKGIVANVAVDSNRLPQDCVAAIEEYIRSLSSDVMYGLTMVRLIEVSIQSEDLDRFRTISQELYLTEKEIEYLHRTNDFKNRLTDIENDQSIHEAQSDLDLHRKLQQINQDKLLSEDELDKFYLILSRERKIREAKSEEEIAAAMQDIERTQLLRSEDLEVLKSELATNSHTRGFALQMIQLKDSITYQQTLKAAEYDMQTNLVKIEIEQSKLRDDYKDEQYYKQLEREKVARKTVLDLQRQEAEQRLDIEDRQADRQMNDFMRMAELKRDMQSQEHRESMEREDQRMAQEREMAKIDSDKERMIRESAQNMSAEQLMALAANENLDAEAARQFAQSFSAGKDVEQIKDSAEKFDKLNQARVDDMKEMMRMMMESNVAMNNNMANVREESYQENKERLLVEQQRLDKTQDRALDYTTRNNIGVPQPAVPQMAPPQPTPAPKSVGGCKCSSCGFENESATRFCENCGNEI